MARQPPIFVINLDRDAQRLSSISEQLSEQELEFCRFPAISGLDVPSSLQAFFVTDEKDPPLTSGEVGCYASHLSLHKKIYKEIKEPCLILEDDVQLPIDLGPLFAAARHPAGLGCNATIQNVRTKPLDQDMRRIWDCGLTTLGIVPPPIRPDIFESQLTN